ncbi:hypothetical protein BH11PSE10_BH11PSE10_16420 [soil metagenome]
MNKYMAFALALLLSTVAIAQQGFDSPPEPAPAKPLQIPVFAEARLPNGVRVVVAERHAVPLVSALLLVDHAGSLLDPPGKAGLANLTFTVMSKGALQGLEALDAAAIAGAAEAQGASLEVGVGAQASRIGMTVPVSRLDDSLALMTEVLRTPTLPAEELERSRAQLLDSLKLSLADPGSLAAQLAQRLYWGDTPRGAPITPASLARVKQGDLVAFHRSQVRPDRVTLILAGDIDLAQARALADKHLGSWKQNRMLAPTAPNVSPNPLATRSLLIDLPGAGQSAVVVTAPYAALGNAADQRAGLRAGALATAVLGIGYSSRLNQQVRIKRGLSYGAVSGNEALPGGGMLSASAQTKHASALEVADLLRGEILKLASDDVPAPELAARQAVLVGDFGRQLETTATLADLAADQVIRQRGLDELAQWPTEMLAVNAGRVRAFAQQYWAAEVLRTVVVADLKVAGDGLRQRFPDAWVIRASELEIGSANLRRGARR